MRRSVALRGAVRTHAHNIHTATNAQPRLRVSSIPKANSTLGMNVNGASLFLMGWTEIHESQVEIPYKIHKL
jgi:hypothetical protein